MSQQIIDLDEILGADKKVKLGGQIYVLPPDLPVELYLRITNLAGTGASDEEMIPVLYENLLELFRYKQPKLESLPLSMSHLVTAVAKIYGDDDAPEERPTRATRGGASTRPKARSRSRR